MWGSIFRKRLVSVEVGNVFAEPLQGKRRIFKELGIAERVSADAFETQWEITEILKFNGLAHARLYNHESGIIRTIAVDTLARQDIYNKKTG